MQHDNPPSQGEDTDRMKALEMVVIAGAVGFILFLLWMY